MPAMNYWVLLICLARTQSCINMADEAQEISSVDCTWRNRPRLLLVLRLCVRYA